MFQKQIFELFFGQIKVLPRGGWLASWFPSPRESEDHPFRSSLVRFWSRFRAVGMLDLPLQGEDNC
jgi:hypothetical protein